MNSTLLLNYNLRPTLLGGQAFNWDLINEYYYGFTKDKVIKLQHNGETLFWQTFPENDDYEFVRKYLQLDIDYGSILQSISKDENMKLAIKMLPHVRILKQDFEQALLSFILTSHKNIKAVRKSVRDLSKVYGSKLEVDGMKFHLFPKAEVLAEVPEVDLKNHGVGFRSGYLQQAAQKVGMLENLSKFNSADDARVELLKLRGVGDKIADCVLIFALGYYTVVPIDIWGKRVLTDLYGVDPKLKYEKMRNWYRDYFGDYASWAGQFLFEYLRQNYKNVKV